YRFALDHLLFLPTHVHQNIVTLLVGSLVSLRYKHCTFTIQGQANDLQLSSPYNHVSRKTSSLNPTVTFSPSVALGRFMSIPSVAKYSVISSVVKSLTLSFMFNFRYLLPLVLKNLLAGKSLLDMKSRISSFVGGFSTIWISLYVMWCSSNHFFAFLHVPHFG